MKTGKFPIRFWLPLLFVCSLTIHPLDAQKVQKQLWYQWDDLVYPAKLKEYTEAAKAINEFLKEQDFPYRMNAFSSDDFHFYYAMPISSFAAIDTMEMIWKNIFEKAGEEKLARLGQAFIGTQEAGRRLIFQHRPDLSYKAENDYLEGKEANFMQLYIMYPMYAMEDQFEKVCKKWVDLYKGLNIDVSYDMYQVLVGDEDPGYFFLVRGENAAAYYAKNMELWETMKEEAAGIQEEMFSLLKKVDAKHIWYREDLSFVPGE